MPEGKNITVKPVYSGNLLGSSKLAAIEKWPDYTVQYLWTVGWLLIERWPDYTVQ